MTGFNLRWTSKAINLAKKAKGKHPEKKSKIRKALRFLSTDPTHPSLGTHTFQGRTGPEGRTIYISYVENNTPSAWRIYWSYGGKDEIIIVYLGPHQ